MVDAPDVAKHAPEARYTDTIGKYIVIYACILVLAGLQFVIGYSHVDITAKFARMLFVALAESGLALLFFMHLWAEKRGFMLFVLIMTGFVLLSMQFGWTDSYRMELGVPNSQPKVGAVQ
jgi:cytochrome c oxidase subunit IV